MSNSHSSNTSTNKGNAASGVRDDPSVTPASLQSFLDGLGLDASQVDGASLKALQDLLGDDVADNEDYSPMDQKPLGDPNVARAMADRSDQDPPTWSLPRLSPPQLVLLPGQTKPNDDSNSDSAAMAATNSDTDENDHIRMLPSPPLDPDSLTPFERYVVQQLEHQNRMIEDLHRRWETQQQQQQQQPIHSTPAVHGIPPTAATPPPIRDEPGEIFHRHAARVVPRPAPAGAAAGWWNPPEGGLPPLQQPPQPVREIPEPLRQQHPPQQRLPPVTQWVHNLWHQARATMPAHSLRNTRGGRIATLYWRLGRLHLRHARNNNNNMMMDPFMLFKLIFMLSFLWSKFRPRSSSNSNDDSSNSNWQWTIKLYATAIVLLMGLLFHTGVLAYTYQFWFQRDYARRIWAGEDFSVDQVVTEETEWLEQPHRRRGGGNGGAELFQGWQNTFLLGGRVAGVNNNNDNDEEPPPLSVGARLVGLLQDICFFFGSFVLSIFPMWRAAPRQPVVAAAADETNENHNHDGAAALVDPAVGPGIVAPPVDPTGPEEEDSDDGDNANGPPPAQG